MGKFKGYPLPLGVTEYGDYVNFSIAAFKDQKCELYLYKKGELQTEAVYELLRGENIGDVAYIGLPIRKVRGREYNYCINGKIVTDPYVKELCKYENEVRGKALLDAYDWEEDKSPRIPDYEVVAYSMHVRGLTMHKSSRVKNKGCFKGVIEKIPYLKELGVNQIQCMPIYAFDEGESYTNYWGYGDGFFFAPQGKFATLKSAVRELKDMIKQCHRAGIEVVLNLPFSDMFTPQMVMDCLRFYVMEYHIDGFVLEPTRVSVEGAKADPILKDVKILIQKNDYMMDMRRFLRGDNGTIDGVMYWLKQVSEPVGSYNYIATHNGFTLADVFSYNEKHNEANGENNQDGPDYNCSYNCGAEGVTRKKGVQALRRQMVKDAFFLLLTSQGTPCILAGDEFSNSQQGNNNVYCQDNELAWLDWRQMRKETDLWKYVRTLIQLRQKYPILHSETPLLGRDYMGCGVPDVSFHSELAWQTPSGMACKSLGVYYHDEKQTISECFAAYNVDTEDKIIALPALARGKRWHLVLSTMGTEEGLQELLLDNQRTVTLKAREMALYIGK